MLAKNGLVLQERGFHKHFSAFSKTHYKNLFRNKKEKMGTQLIKYN